MNQAQLVPARLALTVLVSTVAVLGAAGVYQASAQSSSLPPAVVGTWNATFNDNGQLNPVLLTFHADRTLLMSGVNGEGSSLTLGGWSASPDGGVAFEARVLGAEKGKYMGLIRLRGNLNVHGAALTGTMGGEAVTPDGKVLFSWKGETIKALRVAPPAAE
ncbi:hypothetical protein [Deinococcus aetherius]|nr:hypothetical protein [Deinococcus aetherius]